MTQFMAFQVGCIECGEPSAILGLYGTPQEAVAKCSEASALHKANWRGQRHHLVYNMDTFEEIPA